MAKRSDKFGDDASPQDKKKITKEGLRKALSILGNIAISEPETLSI